MGWDKVLKNRGIPSLDPVVLPKKRKQIRRKKKVKPTKFQALSMEEIIDQLTILVYEYSVWEEPWPFHNGTVSRTVTRRQLEEILFSEDFRTLLEATLPLSFGASPTTREVSTISYEEFLPLLNSFNYHMTNQKWGNYISCSDTITIRGVRRRRITFTGSTARYMYLLNLVDVLALACPNKTPFEEERSEQDEEDPAALATVEYSAVEDPVVATSIVDGVKITERQHDVILEFPTEPPALEEPFPVVLKGGGVTQFGDRFGEVDEEATARARAAYESRKQILEGPKDVHTKYGTIHTLTPKEYSAAEKLAFEMAPVMQHTRCPDGEIAE